MPGAETSRTAQESAPHELANEMTRDASVQSHSTTPDTRRPAVGDGESPPRTVERNVGRTVLLIVLAAAVIGLAVSAIVFQRLALLAIGAVFVIPFLLMVSAPVWVAAVTKQAQDATVQEQRGEDA